MKYSVRPVAFRPEWVEELGDMESAIFLQQLYYWSDKGEGEGGWIYKSVADIEYETTLSDKQQRRVIGRLKDTYISYELRKAPDGRVTRYFRVDRLPLGIPPLPKGKGYPAKREESSITESTTESTHKAGVLEKLKSDTGSVSGGQYSPDGFSPVDRLAMKRRAEKALGFKRANKWSQLLFGSAWDFRTAFKKYEGYDYPDPILLDEVAKTLAHWFELGETRDSIRDMLIAFFEGKKHEKVTITPNSVFSSHTYNSWKQNKL